MVGQRSIDMAKSFLSELTVQLGGSPTLDEILEVLGWCIPTTAKSLVPAPGMPVIFQAVRRPAKNDVRPSRVVTLNDSAFITGTDFIQQAVDEMATMEGRSVALAEIAPYLLGTLRSVPDALIDESLDKVSSITIRKNSSTRRPKIGDVLGIPTATYGYRLAVVLARNRFGVAIGLFKGVFLRPSIESLNSVATLFPCVYTDDSLVRAGTWRIIDNSEGLLRLFPGEPEIYHMPNPSCPDLGQFGGAETADGSLRPVTLLEAERVGLTDGSYVQIYLGEQLQELLNRGDNIQ